MHSIKEDLDEFHKQLNNGLIQNAYRALLAYMMALRTQFTTRYGDASVSDLYQGAMDMSYFAIFPPSLKRLGLKIPVVFNYQDFRFEAWLAARNRKLQRQYWELFKGGDWAEYHLVTPSAGIDAILAYHLAGDFDLSNPDWLTSRIESATVAFISDIEKFLSEHQL